MLLDSSGPQLNVQVNIFHKLQRCKIYEYLNDIGAFFTKYKYFKNNHNYSFTAISVVRENIANKIHSPSYFTLWEGAGGSSLFKFIIIWHRYFCMSFLWFFRYHSWYMVQQSQIVYGTIDLA